MAENNEVAQTENVQKESFKAKVSRNYNRVIIGGMAVMPMVAMADIDITSGTTQIAAGTAGVLGLGAAKMAPAAASWTMSMLTRTASR